MYANDFVSESPRENRSGSNQTLESSSSNYTFSFEHRITHSPLKILFEQLRLIQYTVANLTEKVRWTQICSHLWRVCYMRKCSTEYGQCFTIKSTCRIAPCLNRKPTSEGQLACWFEQMHTVRTVPARGAPGHVSLCRLSVHPLVIGTICKAGRR